MPPLISLAVSSVARTVVAVIVVLRALGVLVIGVIMTARPFTATAVMEGKVDVALIIAGVVMAWVMVTLVVPVRGGGGGELVMSL